MDFSSLKLAEPLLRSLKTQGYETPTPIQQKAIPVILDGKDVFASAQTGTGKTAAFSLPMLQIIAEQKEAEGAHDSRHIRALILTPTRELANQINQNITNYSRHLRMRSGAIYGGVGYGLQLRMIRQGIDILTATPGRLMDLMEQGQLNFSKVQMIVLDECDRMLDMGFIEPVKKIIKTLPKKRQSLLFSATMPREVIGLTRDILKDPVHIKIAPSAKVEGQIQESVYYVEQKQKGLLLANLLDSNDVTRVLVFTRTKRGASRTADNLNDLRIRAELMHGGMSQRARERSLQKLKSGQSRVLVATDVAARGIDVEGISHVINYDIPENVEAYVHRIGRTGRAGAKGNAITFCGHDERRTWRSFESEMRKKVPETSLPKLQRREPIAPAFPQPKTPFQKISKDKEVFRTF